MDDVRYTILFDGKTLPGVSKETVRVNLARLFNCDVSQIDSVLSGGEITLEHNLSKTEANRYLKILFEAGAIARKSQEVTIQHTWTSEPGPEIDSDMPKISREPNMDFEATFTEFASSDFMSGRPGFWEIPLFSSSEAEEPEPAELCPEPPSRSSRTADIVMKAAETPLALVKEPLSENPREVFQGTRAGNLP